MPSDVITLSNGVRFLSCEKSQEDEFDDRIYFSTCIAFNANYFNEEIEGLQLYQEKYFKEKIKTLTVALVICLNIDIDPPDVQKIPPFCRTEAWFDPSDANSLRALETIGKNLQAQYERWQPRARYKQCLDPTLDDVKKLCVSLRRNAKDDRILFHYNGHGVPRPTDNGEIWVFNTKFTKYIPLSLYDLQRWLGAPSVYVIDCQNAGRVIRMYETFCRRRLAEHKAAQQQTEAESRIPNSGETPNPTIDPCLQPNTTVTLNATDAGGRTMGAQAQPGSTPVGANAQLGASLVSMENTIMLAACREDEDLPQNPELPADLFTACLTTPIRMALRWHFLRHQEYFPGYLDEHLLDRIPGSHSNRMSLLGEVNWIFTAVTDTIAWCSFPIDIFQKLFRQDLLVASLFRNFLLAERIMKTYGCQPVSAPSLLPTFRHPMWDAWDHALDRVVHYLPRMLKIIEGSPYSEKKLPIIAPTNGLAAPTQINSGQGCLPVAIQTSGQVAEPDVAHCPDHSEQGLPVNGIQGHKSQPRSTVIVNAQQHYRQQQQLQQRAPYAQKDSRITGQRTSVDAPSEHNQFPPGVKVNLPKQSGQPQLPARPEYQLNQRDPNTLAAALAPTTNLPSGLPNQGIQRTENSQRPVLPFAQSNPPTSDPVAHEGLPVDLTRPLAKPVLQSGKTAGSDFQGERKLASKKDVLQTSEDVKQSTKAHSHSPKQEAHKESERENVHADGGPTAGAKVTFSDDDSDEDDEEEDSDDESDDFEVDEEDEQEGDDKSTERTSAEKSKLASSLEELNRTQILDSGNKVRPALAADSDSKAMVERSRLRVSCPDLAPGHRARNQRNVHVVQAVNAGNPKIRDPPREQPVPVTRPHDAPKFTLSSKKTAENLVQNPMVDELTAEGQKCHPSENSSNFQPKDTKNEDAAAIHLQGNVVNETLTKQCLGELDHPPTKQQTHHQLTLLRRQQHAHQQLYALQAQAEIAQNVEHVSDCTKRDTNMSVGPNPNKPVCPPRPHPNRVAVPTTATELAPPPKPNEVPANGVNPCHDYRAYPLPSGTKTLAPIASVNAVPNHAPPTAASATSAPVNAGSVIGGSGPASFFTSQMTAFKVWLQTADEKHPPATQLPILLQILLSQSHRIRAMQLLSEFLDLGPWAVAHCLTVGILPYIVRLFHSPVPEVKPHLVFIWGKIIASAQTEFGRNDSVRDFGYKYFITCLGDTENLSPLTRTITAFALAKMLEKEPNGEPDAFFQDVYLKQNFIPLVLTQLYDNPPNNTLPTHVRMRLWLIFSLAKLWYKNDEARWFGVRYNVAEALFAYLDDVSPEVRAATVYALGTLIDNECADLSKQDQADQISHQVGGRLVKVVSLDASPLVQCELVVAFRGLVRQFEAQICAIAQQYTRDAQAFHAKTSSPPSPPTSAKLLRCSLNTTSFSCTGQMVNRSLGPAAVDTPDACVRSEIGVHSQLLHTSSQKHRRSASFGHNFFNGTTNIYAQFWLALLRLASDPYPGVCGKARTIVNYLLKKTAEKFGHQDVLMFPLSQTTLEQNSSQQPSESPPIVADQNLPPETESEPPPTLSYPKTTTNETRVVTSPLKAMPTSTGFQLIIEVSPNRPRQAKTLSGTDGGSGPPSAVDKSPDLRPKVSHSVSTSPTADSSDQSLVRRSSLLSLPHASVALTSTFLIHSVQFPGRRHQRVDQRVRDPLMEHNTPGLQSVPLRVAATPSVSVTRHNDHSPLDEIKTEFFAWSCRWFTQPLLAKYGGELDPSDPSDLILRRRRSSSPDPELAALGSVSVDPEAVAYADRLKRLAKQREKLKSNRIRWTEVTGSPSSFTRTRTTDEESADCINAGRLCQLSIQHTSAPSNLIRFHPFQPHLAVADPAGVSIRSLDELKQMNYLPTPSEPSLSSFSTYGFRTHPSKISGIEFLNSSEERGLILTSHEDGRIRIWRNYLRDLGQDPEIVTAWVGMNDLLLSSNPAGVVTHWSQYTNQLTLAGDARHIRIWDCQREARIRDIPTGADACVTTLARSPDLNLIAAGFGDGGVKVFDLRSPASSSSSSHHGDCHMFSGQGDSGWIHSIGFSFTGRLYATGSTGSIAAWQLTSGAEDISRPTRRVNRSMTVNVQPGARPAAVPTPGSRFRRLPYPPRLSIPSNSPVHCADLKVDLPSYKSHLLVAGVGGLCREVVVHRIHDGSIHSTLKSVGGFAREGLSTPCSVAIHPIETMLAVGLRDKSLLLLTVESRQL
ncbi:unnamed protein product [Calicophoron daubneyi]|uniref:Raptor N-terminal CASPase-like domain-containing protein n=1 Tax=Calicophoron daubneyi TaxID=300641 RepID=A0AAV2TH86_CALDB